MEMKLTYNATYKFTTADYGDVTDPLLTFETYSRPLTEWRETVGSWLFDLDPGNLDKAIDAVAYGIISVSQNGEKYPIGNRENAWALHAAIEKSDPGQGDRFIICLALGHYIVRSQKSRDLAGNSDEPSPPSDDGNNQNES